MRRVNYAEAVIGTDPEVADLVFEYAGRLAELGRADTVPVLAVRGDGPDHDGPVQEVALLLGPASQITAWSDDAPFPGDASAVVADLRARLARLSTVIPPSEEAPADGSDVLDDLD